jgi:microsomal dipeptidase-like Zn-dependent dipeptidase
LIYSYTYYRTLYDLNDTSKYPILIEYLLAQGNWTDDDIIKLIGGNILRVMEKNEAVK